MSMIDQMSIQGIRAFDPGTRAIIKFRPPLTLVAGQNGSGKTTIIECLKFVTTGQLPPGSKLQGAFIHDPGLEGNREVVAQVKLGFHSADGTRLVATRSMSLQLKKDSRSQKTLEAALLLEKNGQRSTLSTRVAELDTILPQYLGVSPAVIENVIFCHQDESLWPLADSGTVKKKFDDIFDSAKYTRAIKELDDIRKKHKNDLGRQEVLAQTAKKDKDRARKVKGECDDLRTQIDSLRAESSNLHTKMDSSKNKAQAAWNESKQYSSVVNRLETFQREAQNKATVISDLEEHLKPINETDEWLKKTLAEFDATMGRYESDRRAKKESYIELKDELTGLQQERSQKLSLQGKYEKEEEDYHSHLARRKEMVKAAATEHSIRGFDASGSDDKVEDFIFKVKKIAKERQTAEVKARREAESQKSKAQELFNQLTEKKKSLLDQKSTIKAQMTKYDNEAAEYQRRVDRITVDEGNKAVLETRLKEIGERLEEERTSSVGADHNNKLRQITSELRTLDDESSKLNEELIQGTKRAGETAKLSHLKQEVKDKQRHLETLSDAHGSKIGSAVGPDWTPATLRDLYESAAKEALGKVQKAERERDSCSRDFERISFAEKESRKTLTSRQSQWKSSEKKVVDVLEADISEFETALQNAETYLEEAKDDMRSHEGLRGWFENVLQTAQEKNACRLCSRPFKGPNDAKYEQFEKRIHDLIKKASVEATQDKLDQAAADHEAISAVASDYETWKRLSGEISGLEKELAVLTKQREELDDKLEAHDKEVEGREGAKKELDALSKTIESICRAHQDISSLQTQIGDFTQKTSQQGPVKTLEDIQSEIQTITEKKQVAEKTRARLTSEQETSTSELHRLEISLSDVKNELSTVSSQLERKADLDARVAEYKKSAQHEREKIERTDEDIHVLEPKIATSQEQLRSLAKQWEDDLAELEQAARTISETVKRIELLNDEIQAYLEKGGSDRLTGVRRDLKTLQQNIERIEREQVDLTRQINAVEEQLRDSENTKRHYTENLKYRRETRALAELHEQIQELEAKDAHTDLARLDAEAQQYEKEYHKYSAAIERVSGQMVGLDQTLERNVKEFDMDLKDAGLRYKEAHIKVETTKAAVEDIGRYRTALDRAVMKYHSLKMQQVNEIIGDLWRKTYKGSDVDTIYIKSEAETKTNRSHNYRVIMVKRDYELDMRGRCSAGQRVLACIIVRLALAECFSTGCGVIALDEPTTNLDEDNSKALAESLHEIIQDRETQKNFQLIIITHDERFLRDMRAIDFTNNFYRVSRDHKECSVIEKMNMSEVM